MQKSNKRQFGEKLKGRKGGREIDAALRGQRQLLDRRISFVPAKRAQNGDIAASGQSGASGIKPERPTSVQGSAGDGGGKKRLEEEAFQEVEHPLYPRTRIRRILEWKKVSKIGPGLQNLGNTCFCNAVLQCLTYTAPLANFCLSREHTNRIGGSSDNAKYDALLAMERHISSTFSSEKTAIRPTNIVSNLKKIGPRLKIGRQEDAHEFTRLLIEGMHLSDLGACKFTESPYSRPAQTGVLHNIFGGHLRSQVQCETCKFNSNTYDAFLDLSLEVKKAGSIQDALKSFTKAEVLDGANKYRCSSCGCKTRAVKRFSIHRVPYVLHLHLKRFETQWGGHSAKISRHVTFPMTLSLDEFVSKGEESGSRGCVYSLYGVVVHSGHSVRRCVRRFYFLGG
jgi:ubiquitin carboxyl-terminal hydrolase 36/42